MGMFRGTYLQWMKLRLPWRKDVYMGTDLDGNLYFERLVDTYRSRRHVIYRKDLALSEYSDKVIPIQWQAWMRHTRHRIPTLDDLNQDIQRQEQIADNVQKLAAKEARLPISPEDTTKHAHTRQPQFQKSTPGESFQPENWAPAATSSASGNKTGSTKKRHNP
ncbi:hypothetical protein LPJ62_002246 [Coemansia sp. RSA 2167]|nr:hypothetical protein LPJ62_002246 [Coemansia sp. RSA 2167]KAJ2146854.1 hypothetical protein IW142_001883 [Coemansia sp. RSA 564]KAJ2408799.1 hypothetical protein J3F80_001807 [Coemansia sp. RSA 2526]KAJ2586725.1 hypothetical protein IWW49_003861 [Coemansia sp. RSA 1797]